jgi:hypothetical protein
VADLWSIISANYKTVGLNTNLMTGKYVNVDPDAYQGTWSGKYANNTKFTVTISEINGFKAKVRYQSGSTLQYQQVLIKNDAFRIGDSKFTLQRNGMAQVKTVTTDPATGSSYVDTAYASRS